MAPACSSATSTTRSPRAALAEAPRQNACAFPRVSGSMKPTDAPPSTQSRSTSLSPSSSRSLAVSRRRILNQLGQVAVGIGRVAGPIDRPDVQPLAARLREYTEIPFAAALGGLESGLFPEFAPRAGELVFVGIDETLRHRPGAVVLLRPIGTSRVNEKDFGARTAPAVEKQARADGRHAASIPTADHCGLFKAVPTFLTVSVRLSECARYPRSARSGWRRPSSRDSRSATTRTRKPKNPRLPCADAEGRAGGAAPGLRPCSSRTPAQSPRRRDSACSPRDPS